MTVFTYQRAECPILVSIPHAGVRLCNDMSKRLTPAARGLADTDWYVDRLYDFLNNTSVGVLRADYSRYVVDLNRAPDNVALYPGQFNSEICPVKTFSGADIYCRGLEPTDAEIGDRIRRIWSPYHACLREELERLRRKFGFAILWDAHSIPSRVPLLFDGELPHLNVGTNDGASCDPELAADISELLGSADYSIVVNGRFRGGYITRHYGDPAGHVHAIQLEISQRAYMDEANSKYSTARSDQLRRLLHQAFDMLGRMNQQYAKRSKGLT